MLSQATPNQNPEHKDPSQPNKKLPTAKQATPNQNPEHKDPIDSDDFDVLRHEILRLRDQLIGLEPRGEILEDRILELEKQVENLQAQVNQAQVKVEHYDRLARSLVVRIARRLRLL